MVWLMKYWKPLVVAMVLALSFVAGKTWESNKRDAQLLAERKAAQQAYEKQVHRADKLAQDLERERAKQRERKDDARSKLAEVVSRSNVYAMDCIDDDGLHIINNALSKHSNAASERDGTLPRTLAIEGQDR